MPRIVRAGAVCLLIVTTAAAGGCSQLDDDAKAGSTPSVVVAPGASPSATLSTPAPTVTPSPTETAPVQLPTSKFEKRPQVEVARAWAAKVAAAINDDKRNLGPARALMTAHGKNVLPPLFTVEYGRFYPGPVPFTPTAVSSNSAGAQVDVCLVSAGFSRVSGTTTTDARRVDPARITFVRSGGDWKIDELQARAGSCAKVKVEDLTDPAFSQGGSPTATPAPSAPTPRPSSSPSTGISPAP